MPQPLKDASEKKSKSITVYLVPASYEKLKTRARAQSRSMTGLAALYIEEKLDEA
ncbi:MAG TPA: hypothetical protein VGG32_03745 [Thermoplasmata archaeon]|jgi:hypothetical protein